jgi:hypothetical protein
MLFYDLKWNSQCYYGFISYYGSVWDCSMLKLEFIF